jgi:hypothetical protein
MTTITLTPEQALNLHVPATEELLRGWVGPVVYRGMADYAYLGRLSLDPLDEWVACPGVGSGVADNHAIRIPLSRPECRHRLIDVMAAGVRCAQCKGYGLYVADDGNRKCLPCDGTGWLRKPADLSHFRNVKAEGWTSAELEAALLYICWIRMAAGMRPLGQVWGPWDYRGVDQNDLPGWERPIVAGPAVLIDNPGQWPRVEETQDPGKYSTARPFRRYVAAGLGPSTCVEVDAWLLAESDWRASALIDITPEGPVIRAEVPGCPNT